MLVGTSFPLLMPEIRGIRRQGTQLSDHGIQRNRRGRRWQYVSVGPGPVKGNAYPESPRLLWLERDGTSIMVGSD